MRLRIVLGVLGAVLMFALEWLSIIFILIYKELAYVFFPISTLGADFLVYARDDLGWSFIPPGGLGELPLEWIRGLSTLNIICYTALGFFLGWMLGRRLSPAPKPR